MAVEQVSVWRTIEVFRVPMWLNRLVCTRVGLGFVFYGVEGRRVRSGDGFRWRLDFEVRTPPALVACETLPFLGRPATLRYHQYGKAPLLDRLRFWLLFVRSRPRGEESAID